LNEVFKVRTLLMPQNLSLPLFICNQGGYLGWICSVDTSPWGCGVRSQRSKLGDPTQFLWRSQSLGSSSYVPILCVVLTFNIPAWKSQ
jgi:hypothetical protein